jgi:hypothetical protein
VAGVAELEPRLLVQGGPGGAKPLRPHAPFLVFKEGLRPVDEHRASRQCGYFMAQVASDVAISKHRPLLTQTRQGLEKKGSEKDMTTSCSGDY